MIGSSSHCAVTSHRPRLPPELLSYIVSFVAYHETEWQPSRGEDRNDLYTRQEADVKDALLACSTASRSLRHIALPHLFHTIAINVDTKLAGTESIIYADVLYHSWSEFVEFLVDSDCSTAVRGMIQELRLSFVTETEDWSFEDEDRPRYYTGGLVVPEQLIEVFSRLPALRVVALRDVFLHSPAQNADIEPVSDPTLDQLLRAHKLDRFQIDRSWNIGSEYTSNCLLSLLQIVGCFGEVKCISINEFNIEVEDDTDDAPPFPSGIGSLKLLDCTGIEAFLSMLVRDVSKSSVPMPIESLELGHLDSSGRLETIADLLTFLTPTLRKLSISGYSALLEKYSQVNNSGRDLRMLSACRQLESFAFEWRAMLHPTSESMITGLCTILSFLRDCPNLRDVTLQFGVMHALDWKLDVQTTLAGLVAPVERELLQLHSLQKVTISLWLEMWVREPCDPAFVEEFRRVNFPNLYQRGLL